MSPNARPAAALLIDADNLSPEVAEKAIADLAKRGLMVSVLRAYGSPETLAAAREVLQKHAARVVVNQGKGTTDAALVVDAMDLLHSNGLPDIVAIGSSDGDFAPLAVRLRESGRHVLCYAQGHKADLGVLQRVYAEVIPLAPGKAARAAPAPAPAPAAAPAATSAARKSGRKTTSAAGRKAAAAPAEAPDIASSVWSLLEEIPGFADGEAVELNAVVKKLRDAKAMTRSATAPSFFKKLGLPVELMPARAPNKLRRLDAVA
ncbi:NYN domain-containing protein [Ramlibacter henchirensis]|uniref:NYN domain-containing protein n=1 Tax=Ramlibacter henchirensis TaxID=204072 RepID=UPI0014308CA7|nr:NYN domain-containing protein [Ramlibacter henchirensis]